MLTFSHEEPILLVLPADRPLAEALPAFLDHPDVRHYALPPLWCLDPAGIDLPAALPQVRTITRDNVGEVVETLQRLCTPEHLDGLVLRAWREADERVRQHHLGLTIGQTFATIFKMRRATIDQSAPESFRRDRIHENGFEIQYRLVASDAVDDFRAPEQEGSLMCYPFDPANAEAREEHGLGEGDGAVLEAFAYERGREQHRAFLEGLAAQQGWRVIDPRVSG